MEMNVEFYRSLDVSKKKTIKNGTAVISSGFCKFFRFNKFESEFFCSNDIFLITNFMFREQVADIHVQGMHKQWTVIWKVSNKEKNDRKKIISFGKKTRSQLVLPLPDAQWRKRSKLIEKKLKMHFFQFRSRNRCIIEHIFFVFSSIVLFYTVPDAYNANTFKF